MRYENTPMKNGAFRYSYRDFGGQVAIYCYFITLMIVKLNRPSLLLATERGSRVLLIVCSAWFNIYTTIHLVGCTCIYNLSREHDEITPRKCFPHYNPFCRKTNSNQQWKRLVKLPRHMSDIIVTHLVASSHISFPATRFKLHWDLQKHIWEVFPYFTLLCWICINELNSTSNSKTIYHPGLKKLINAYLSLCYLYESNLHPLLSAIHPYKSWIIRKNIWGPTLYRKLRSTTLPLPLNKFRRSCCDIK